MSDESGELSKGLLEGMIEALSDKHSQMDIRLQGLSLDLGGDRRLRVTMSGTVSVSVHMRDLTPEEKSAHMEASVARIHASY